MGHGNTIHSRLNRIALSSNVMRRITYLFASTFAYILVVWALCSLYISFSKQDYLTVVWHSTSAALLSRILVEIIYIFYKRPRPSSINDIEPLFLNTNPSFPSGHAAFFGGLSTALMLLEVQFAFAFCVATLLMGFARAAAGVHFISDIIGGFALGIVSTLILFFVLGLY